MIEITDSGFVPVRINGVEKPIDLFDAFNRLVIIQQEADDACADVPAEHNRDAHKARRRNQGTAAYLDELGFGKVSHGLAIQFTNAVYQAVAGLEKKDESPASATPSAS